MALQIHTYESVSSKALRRLRRSGALREGTRTKAITTGFLFPCPSATAAASSVVFFIYCFHKPPHTPLSIQCEQDRHTQGCCGVCTRLQERLCSCSRLLWQRWGTHVRRVQTEPREHTDVLSTFSGIKSVANSKLKFAQIHIQTAFCTAMQFSWH